MKRSKFGDEQIRVIVREGGAGRKVADVCRTHGITEQTYYRWKADCGGLELSEMQRLKQLEDKNRRLKQIVADQTLDIRRFRHVRQFLKYVGLDLATTQSGLSRGMPRLSKRGNARLISDD